MTTGTDDENKNRDATLSINNSNNGKIKGFNVAKYDSVYDFFL
jgi:hypothetical protein